MISIVQLLFMHINYNMMCIVSQKKDHFTFPRRKPSLSLNTYYIQEIRFRQQSKKTSL